ncbi:hypothetical protein Hte_006397 [Hypoxylon texense]
MSLEVMTTKPRHPDDPLPSIECEEDFFVAKDPEVVVKVEATSRSSGSESSGPDEDVKRKLSPQDDVPAAEHSRRIKRFKIEIEKVELEREKAEWRLEKTTNKLKEATKEVEKWRGKAYDNTDSFLDLHMQWTNTFRPVYTSDQKVIRTLFKTVKIYVLACAQNDLVGVLEGEAIPEEVEKALDKVSEKPGRKFLTAGKLQAMMFFQALMWRFLCTELFDNPFKLWGKDGEFGKAMASFHTGEFGGDEAELDNWRGLTGKLLMDCPVDDAKIERLKGELLQLIKPFIIKEKKDKIDSEIFPVIESILKAAVHLARYLNAYRDRYEVMRKDPSDARDVSLAFDFDWMTNCGPNVDDHDRNVVDLVFSPALVRWERPVESDYGRSAVVKRHVEVNAQVSYRNGPLFTDKHKRWCDLAPKEKEQDRKPDEEDKKPVEQDKKSVEQDKKSDEEDNKPVEQDKKPDEQDEKPDEQDKKPDGA